MSESTEARPLLMSRDCWRGGGPNAEVMRVAEEDSAIGYWVTGGVERICELNRPSRFPFG